MRSRLLFWFSGVCVFLGLELGRAAASGVEAEQYWPQWRGPLASGAAPLADPPLTWSETNHVKWKVPIPGSGSATPVVWADRIFILSALPVEKKAETNSTYQFAVMCLDRKTGKTLWQKIAREETPHEGHHPSHGFASASPVTDGQIVLAYFGSRGLHCYDLDGSLKWSKSFGHMVTKNGFGEGASPALFGDTVIINWDHEGDDFIVALDKRTGKELWRTPRDEGTGWSTPLVVEQAGKRQVVVNATGKVRSYDFATGKEIWSCSGQTVNAIPTPVATRDTVYVTSGFRGSALFAIKLDSSGELSGTDAIRWTHGKNTPYVPSPLLVDDWLYVVGGNDGKLSCFEAKTGAAQFEAERLEGIFSIYASPVSAKDRVYVLGREGTCLVLKKGPKLEILATNKLEDKTDASLALVGKQLFLRGRDNLYCIEE